MTTDDIVFSHDFFSYTLTIILMLSFSSISASLAADDLGTAISDMATAADMDNNRPGLDDINADLKARLIRDYRSPEFNEKEFFATYLALMPPEAILDFLEAEEPTCHRQAHELGRAIFRKFNDINQALLVCGNGCTNACMHGAIGEAFSDDTPHENEDHPSVAHTHMFNIDILIAKMESFCQVGNMSRMHKRGNCAHAMGHALMLKSGHDLNASLTACGKFSESGMDYYCATGVYMQYMDNAMVTGTRRSDVQQNGSNYPCNEFTAYPAACYRYIVSEVKRERNLGLEHLIVLCAQLPEASRSGCFHGLGATYTPVVKTYPGLLKTVCSYGGRSEQVLCIEGAIEKLADFNEQWAFAACQSLTGDNADVCRAAAQGKMYRLDKPTMDLYRTGSAELRRGHAK